jgi:hypothetical protein
MLLFNVEMLHRVKDAPNTNMLAGYFYIAASQ